MAKPGESVKFHFRVLDAAFAGVTGLNAASFTFTALDGDVFVTWAPTVAEIPAGPDGWYSVTSTLPSTTTQYSRDIDPVSAANTVSTPSIAGEIEANDLDSIAALAVRPVATTNGNFAPANELTFSYVEGDTRPISFTVTDAAGVGIDLTDYESLGFGIRSNDGTSSDDQLTTVTGDANGVVILTLSGSENFQSFLVTGEASVRMRWDFQATLTSSSKKFTLARGPFIVLREEFV